MLNFGRCDSCEYVNSVLLVKCLLFVIKLKAPCQPDRVARIKIYIQAGKDQKITKKKKKNK